MKSLLPYSLLAAALLLLQGCRVYTQDIMLKDADDYRMLQQQILEAERAYTIKPFDYLEVAVYTNKGERIIDPDYELGRISGGGGFAQGQQRSSPQYLVLETGEVKLPMLGNVQLGGFTLNQADSILAQAYSFYYKEPFVITRYLNKRVIVLGANGGQVVPLQNQNMNLLEVIALTGGITGRGKAHNIRLIRGDLDKPQVQIINLSTIEGMKQASLQVQSGDIVYIEPIRRLLPETIRDIGPVLGLISNVIALTLVIVSISNQ